MATARADAALEGKVDGAIVGARATYIIGDHKVRVAPQFRMNGGMNQAATREGIAALSGRIGQQNRQIPIDALGRVLAGRGSPAEVATVTQALIDAGKLPEPKPGETDEARVQRMMWRHGVGIDCAGYVQRALVTAHGKTAGQLGLSDPLSEDLGSLSRNPRFKKIALDDVRPGDVISLRDDSPGEPGHAVLVARHEASNGRSMAWRFPSKNPASAPFLAAPHLDVYQVDSSWGAGSDGTGGGVQRRTWVHDPATGNWASFDNKGVDFQPGKTPYPGHAVVGAFRPR